MSGNKRVSQLVEITADEVASNDLFYLVDTSAHEGKKIQANQISVYLNASGSIYALHAQLSDTASYVEGINVDGAVNTSINSLNASSSVSASFSISTLSSISASYAQTSSWAINAINGGTQLITGSTYPITASWANNVNLAKTASFLLYTPGVNNGTASYVVSSSHANKADLADTASFSIIHVSNVDTASYAFKSIVSDESSQSTSASYLVFSPNNGTASYALFAGQAQSHGLADYGIFLPVEQSASFSIIDQLKVQATNDSVATTTIEAIGTAILSYTASIANSGEVSLNLTNRLTGETQSLDNAEISYNVSNIMNTWNTLSTGSLKTGFHLVGQSSLFGDYLLEVTSSSPYITFDLNRLVRFRVASFSDVVTAGAAEAIDFFIFPTASLISGSPNISFSVVSNPSTTHYDSLPGLLVTGSQNILTIDIASQSIAEVKYTWKCNNLQVFSCSFNPSISQLNYSFPNTTSYIYCDNCSLIGLTDLNNTNLVVLDCHNNFLNTLPDLPDSTSYLNFSNNLVTTLPLLPIYLSVINADSNSLSYASVLPNNLLTASFNHNALTTLPALPNSLLKLSANNMPTFTSLPATLSLSMSYLDVSYDSLAQLPTMSVSMSYLDISYNNLPTSEIQAALDTIIANATISTGSFIALGYGAPTVAIYDDLAILTGSNNPTGNPFSWSISYDSFP